jgi:hypothetical protein
MTCAACLWVEESFAKNASKVFECRKCGFKIDRDHNVSCSIFLMHRERFVGRMEPLLTPALAPVEPVVEVISLLTNDKETTDDEETDDEGDGCTGWMWTRRNNTAAG